MTVPELSCVKLRYGVSAGAVVSPSVLLTWDEFRYRPRSMELRRRSASLGGPFVVITGML